jgi:transposase
MASGFQLPDPAPVEQLPRSVDELQALRQADKANQALEAYIQRRVATEVAHQVKEILEQQTLLRHRLFGHSNEAQAGQSRLFNEAELEATSDVSGDDAALAETLETVSPQKPPCARARGKRRPLPAALPRIEYVVEPPEAERHCDCGTPMVKIGEQISEQLDVVPMKIRVIRTIRPRYGCPNGEHAPVTAANPPRVLPRSHFSAGLLALLLTVKYVDGLPLNRFAKVLGRHGVEVPRQSLARAVIGTSQALQPLFNLARDTLLDSAVIHMDETPVQVLKAPDKSPGAQSTMWVQCGGPPDRPVIVFDYDPSRSGSAPLRLLEGWRGYLMTDDYGGYNAVARCEGVEHLACAAHARRKFVEAARVQPQGTSGRADQAITFFARLYRIESALKDVGDEQRLRARQDKSQPVLEAFKIWLDATSPRVTPKSKLGQALAYLAHIWPKFIRYTERGDLPIDNNACENAIRPFVVGRKAWLFSDTPAGAHASAVIYSLVETAKANGHEPYAWLRYVLERLPMAKTVDEMEALMPWNLHEQDLAMNLAACE